MSALWPSDTPPESHQLFYCFPWIYAHAPLCVSPLIESPLLGIQLQQLGLRNSSSQNAPYPPVAPPHTNYYFDEVHQAWTQTINQFNRTQRVRFIVMATFFYPAGRPVLEWPVVYKVESRSIHADDIFPRTQKQQQPHISGVVRLNTAMWTPLIHPW